MDNMASAAEDCSFPWHLGVFDAHCHPTDTLANPQDIPRMSAKVLTVMATRAQDQELVADAANQFGLTREEAEHEATDWSKQHKIVPAFGWHPWFSHQVFDESKYDGASTLDAQQKAKHYQAVLAGPTAGNNEFWQSLPDPRPFGLLLSQTRDYLQRYPLALVGEVGLDRSFRIPEAWLPEQSETRDDALTPGGREGRRLTLYRVSMDHQKEVLLAQLRLAGEMQRAVSLHGVQAHGVLYETVASTWKGHERPVFSHRSRQKMAAAARMNAEPVEEGDQTTPTSGPKPYPPRVCLHSYSGTAETVKPYIAPSVPCDIFFSFSTTVNAWAENGEGKVEAAVKAVPDDKILVESDLHTAGNRMDRYLEEIVRKICEVKGWSLEAGVKKLGQNWRRFVFGQASMNPP